MSLIARLGFMILLRFYSCASIACRSMCCGSALFVLGRVCVERGPYYTVAFDFRVYA